MTRNAPRRSFLFLPATLVLLAAASAVSAQQLPAGFIAEPLGRDWNLPVDLCYLSDGRLLVAEKGGTVWLVVGGEKQNLVLDLQAETLNNGDRGLLSVAADPGFALNGLLYFLLVVDPNADQVEAEQETFGRLVRYATQFAPNGDLTVVPGSRTVLIGDTWERGIPSLHFSHAVGALLFRDDGSLLVTAGDGAHFDGIDAGGRDPGGFGPGRFSLDQDLGAFRSQYDHTLAGKVLRIDPSTGRGLPDNPHYTGDPDQPLSKVFARGLRNPWRMLALPDSVAAGTVLIAEVGWDLWEEVNRLRAGGENFGWPCHEGPLSQPQYPAYDAGGFCQSAVEQPFLSWHHFDPGSQGYTGNCASAMAWYSGSSYPPLYRNLLFFTDFGQGWMRCARLDAQGEVESVFPFATGMGPLVDLAVDPISQDLVYISFGTGAARVRRLRYAGGDLPPVVMASATPTYGQAPLAVQLRASGSYDPEGQPLQYLWDLGDGTTSTLADLDHEYPDPQRTYSVQLTVTDPQQWGASARFVITPGNTPPEIRSWRQPQDGQHYQAGESIALEAKVADAEDAAAGQAPQVSWHVDLVHDHHVHPDTAVASGPQTSFRTEHHGDGTYYVVRLVVTDGRGLSVEQTRHLYDAAIMPRAHLVMLSDTEPRAGQVVAATGHMEYPGGDGPHPSLIWDWGDGSHDFFPGVDHQEDTTPNHVYARPGRYEVRLTAAAGHEKHSVVQWVHVQRPRPAVAIFTPLLTERWIPWQDQEDLAEGLAADLQDLGTEVRVFRYNEQPALAEWLETYLDDDTRDALVVLDVGAQLLYAGEDEGSLAERWLENGNGILWTGAQPFFEYVTPSGLVSSAGAGTLGINEILDTPPPGLCNGVGTQSLLPGYGRDVPSLTPFFSWRGLAGARVAAPWHVDRQYSVDWVGSSDAIALQHQSRGFYAQFYSTMGPGHPRREVLGEFLYSYLIAPQLADPR